MLFSSHDLVIVSVVNRSVKFKIDPGTPNDNLRRNMCSGESNYSMNFGSTLSNRYRISLLKHRIKDSKPGKSSSLRYRKGYFCNICEVKTSPGSFG